MLSGFSFSSIFTAAGAAKLGQIIVGDLTMAGDNVVIMGSLAAGLPEKERRKVLMFGVGMALVFLITFAVIATQLLKITGLVFAGGLLLLWVAYNMVQELRPRKAVVLDDPTTAQVEGPVRSKTFLQAAIQITIADLSMSLDNVLAVAGAAREHPGILIVGLIIAVILMGIAANVIARYIDRYRWIGYVGLLVILWVAVKMIWDGYHDVAPVLGWPAASGLV